MATDGTKIIDGDLAHDIYSEFMDLYDTGADIDVIKKKIEKWRTEIFDDEEREIFITTYALALWEIGFLSQEILEETRQAVEKGAGVEMWREESGEADALARKKELEKLMTNISIPKEKPRQRRKYKKIINFIFKENDVLTFRASDNFYYAVILIKILQYKGRCTYYFVPTTYKAVTKPTITDIEKIDVIGHKVGSGFSKAETKAKQPGVEYFWKNETVFAIPFLIGIWNMMTDHTDLIKFSDKFEVIGQIHIKKGFKEGGSYSGAINFERFIEDFMRQDEKIRIFKQDRIPIKRLIVENNKFAKLKEFFNL